MKIKNSIIEATLIILLLITCSTNFQLIIGQDTKKDFDINNKKDWWTKILKKHNIEIQKSKVFNSVLINGKYLQTYKDSLVFNDVMILLNNNDTYSIITASKSTFHNLDSSLVIGQCKKETFEYKNQSLKPIMIAYYKYYKDEINKFSTLVVCDSMWSDSSYSKKLKTKSHNVGTQKSH